MAVGEYSYETLSPFLPPSPAVETTIAGGEDAGDYVVFRNEISLTSLEPASTDTAATDYFSLDVDDASDEVIDPTPPPKMVAAEERENDAERTPEWTLESGWFRADCRFKSPMLQLHKEILDFCDFLSPTPEEAAARNAAIERVSDVIKYIWPYCRVEVFGSYRTGLYLPSSDIDVVILESNIKTPQIGLQALSRALSQKGIAKKMQVIGKARVPIIKFLEKLSSMLGVCELVCVMLGCILLLGVLDLVCQSAMLFYCWEFWICFDVDNGPKAAEYIQDAISRLPPLRPLCLILKVFLQQRELNEVYSGGVGSYALLAMLIAMLRSVNDCQRSPEQNLGILLVKFFEFYAHRLNTWDVGVSCNGTGTFYLKSRKGFQTKGRPFLISIEDPQTPGNDIGKNSFNYFQAAGQVPAWLGFLPGWAVPAWLGCLPGWAGPCLAGLPAWLGRCLPGWAACLAGLVPAWLGCLPGWAGACLAGLPAWLGSALAVSSGAELSNIVCIFCTGELIRSAFMMAYATLTNTKTIMNLGPNKSILGTIIRPDPVLLERKGGIKGELTFNNLLPGAGEALDSQYDEKQDILCNWQFDNDYEEEPLPRGGNAECSSPSSSGKKRKTSKSKSFVKVKENGSTVILRSLGGWIDMFEVNDAATKISLAYLPLFLSGQLLQPIMLTDFL
uniref:polynucleotide adenylyltransferase n=1 Tax=Chenopodium quinoa TaxID=63459 RepID=A0A803MHC9_CHEQI